MATLVDIEQLKRNIREIESSSIYEETSLAEEESKAFKKILKLASIRERASKKLHERLIKDGFSEQAVSNALRRAIDAHIVDDERYAEAFMRTQLAQGKGRRGVERALEQLDIDSPSEEAWQLVYEQFGDDELERAMALLHRKPPRSKNLREGAYRKLVQKGYSADVAASAARRWSESLAAPECEYFAD
ncbi:regulatory protein RecX [Ellagibacter isourolithinifaciens]|uniref:regulatory protein RecX n=1 Tax=Ellagibacter isourolithinifaciens TaxID=2137581 RepID=UPI003A8CD54D